jgi:hypothetical protein
MNYPIPGEPEEFEQRLDAEELSFMARRDIQILEKANRTITNLLRREPLQYIEVAQNALIQTLEKEKVQLDGKCRELQAQLDGARGALKVALENAQHGNIAETAILLHRLGQFLGEDKK